MFNFEKSQVNQQEVEQLADLLLKDSMIYATAKLFAKKILQLLHFQLKAHELFKNQHATKIPKKVNRLLDILEQYDKISPSDKK